METLLQQGTEYEQYISDIIKQKYINCWVWNKIPSEVLLKIGFINDITQKCDDIGCDILGENKDGTYDYIQCKNYTTLGIENTINISDLSGFYNFVAENDVKNAIVYYSGILSSQILCRKKKIKYVKMPFVKLHNKEIKPRDYQMEAFNKLNNVKRGILEMPCGTGKTLITYLISLNYDNIILLSPLIATTEQLIIHYKNYYNTDKDINFNIISSAHTRNLDNIILGNKNIIGSTFDSCDIINNVISKLTGSIFIVIDEFHNLTENNITDNTNELNKLLVSNYKILFVSATPKKYNEELNSIFGTERYKLSWEDAILNKYICDYNFYYPNNNKIIDYIKTNKISIDALDKSILINKAFFLLESIKTLELKKCIVYLKTIEESEQFKNVLKTINLYYELNVGVYNINYNSSKSIRNASLTKFRNNQTKITILLNVHILDEGIDIPECDSVYLTHPNNNPINIIQRISRANRIYNGKNTAHILVWSKNNEKIDNIIKVINSYIPVKFNNVNSQFINNENNNMIKNDEYINPINIINNESKIDKISFINYLKHIETNDDLIKFIDDFFGLYNEKTKDTDFVIDFDIVVKWLMLRKDSIKRTLIETYRENIDYKVSINKSTTAGRPSESIFLTPDCFKRICMLTKSSKGEEVRSYYIQLEKHLDKYKDNIINDLRNRVKVLERNMKPIEIPKDEGVIYVLKTDENTSLTDIYKIGSSDDFKSRLATHHSSHADNVEVSYVYKTSDVKGVERCLKAVLKDKQYRKRKEFYQIDLEILKKLITNCGDSLLLVKKSKSKNRKTSNKVSGGGQNNNTQSNYFIYLHK